MLRIRGALRLKKLEASDFGLFTALWWPDTPFEKLQILAYLVIWLFTWDDELDEPTGAFMEDLEERMGEALLPPPEATIAPAEVHPIATPVDPLSTPAVTRTLIDYALRESLRLPE